MSAKFTDLHCKEVICISDGPAGYIPPIPKDVRPMAMDKFKK